MPTRARKNRQLALAAGAEPGKRQRAPGPKDARKDKAGRAVLDTIGREHLVRVLSAVVAPDDIQSAEGRMLAYLQSGDFDGHSLTKLMRDAGLTLTEIADLVRNHDILIGSLRASAHIPDVMDDIGEDARSQIIVCPKCEGRKFEAPDDIDTDDEELMGLIDEESLPRCSACAGVGALRQIGDTDARKILLETAGMINKKGPVAPLYQKNVQINNNYGGAKAPEDVSVRVQQIFDTTATREPS